jgi:pyruvate kinase
MAATVETARRLTLAWGDHSVPITPLESMDEMSAFACEVAEREGFASKGDTIVIAAEYSDRRASDNECAEDHARVVGSM